VLSLKEKQGYLEDVHADITDECFCQRQRESSFSPQALEKGLRGESAFPHLRHGKGDVIHPPPQGLRLVPVGVTAPFRCMLALNTIGG
jgi:hypothetical protein